MAILSPPPLATRVSPENPREPPSGAHESQRDSIIQPRVATKELPWDNSPAEPPTLKGLQPTDRVVPMHGEQSADETEKLKISWQSTSGFIRNAWLAAWDSSIKQGHELPDGITCKDGHGNVAVPPRPTASCDSANHRSRQQQQRADPQSAHENDKKKTVYRMVNYLKNKRRYSRSGHHCEAPSRQPQLPDTSQRQPDDNK
jgi:hypothetical protein